MNNTDLLLKLKQDIEEAKTKKNQLEGKLETFTEKLKTDFSSNIDEARIKLSKLEKEIIVKEESFNTKMEEIKGLL